MDDIRSDLHVIFGAGALGMAIAHQLVVNGKRVRMVNRSHRTNLPHEVESIVGDAADSQFTQAVCRGAQVVYHCANPRYHFKTWVEEFPSLQQGILAGAISAGAKLIYGDNLYGYGNVKIPMREDLPYAATTNKGKMRAELAEILMSADRIGRVRVAIARAADFYGEGVLNSTFGDRVFIPAIQGKTAESIGNLDLPHTYTYINDFARTMIILGSRTEAMGQVWHVPNAPTISTREMLNLLFAELQLPAKINAMGKTMLQIGGLFIPEAAESVEIMYQFEQLFIVDSSKFINTFGDISTPHHQAIKNTIAWYRQYLQSKSA